MCSTEGKKELKERKKREILFPNQLNISSSSSVGDQHRIDEFFSLKAAA